MAVRLDATVSAIAREAGLDPDRVSQDLLNIKSWINDSRREISELPIDFSGLQFVGEFATVGNVTAGTVNSTQNQAEITGSSTSWVTANGGSYISIGGSTANYQRISFVTDTTHLTLESSWIGATITGQSYTIWKRDYQLPSKVNRITRLMDLTDTSTPLAYYDPSEFYQKYGFGSSFAQPRAYTQFGTSDFADAYLGTFIATGVTATAASPIINLPSSFGLVTALAPGDRFIIGNSTTSTAFFVDKVLTDSKVALTHSVTISTGGTSATAYSLDRLNIRLYPALSTAHTFMYEAKKKLFDLFDNSDLIEEGWYNAVKKGAIAKAMRYVAHPQYQLAQREYELETANLIRSQYKALNPSVRLKVHIPTRYGWQGRFPSKRDDGA